MAKDILGVEKLRRSEKSVDYETKGLLIEVEKKSDHKNILKEYVKRL